MPPLAPLTRQPLTPDPYQPLTPAQQASLAPQSVPRGIKGTGRDRNWRGRKVLGTGGAGIGIDRNKCTAYVSFQYNLLISCSYTLGMEDYIVFTTWHSGNKYRSKDH